MGNTNDSRATFEGGYLFVKTDRPFYYAGDIIYGKIYIRADQPIKAKNIAIKIEGKEKSSSIVHRDKSYVKCKAVKKIFDYKGNAFIF